MDDVSVKIESMSHSIAFAPNITPGTYNDPPSPAEPSAESLLFPASDDCSAASRRAAAAHAKKKPENHIPRPPNAFILFRSSFIKQQHVSSEVETNHSTLSKIIGLTWQNLPHEERQVWHAKAKAALEEHKRKFPQYAFRPMHTKGKAPAEKRKVREVEPKDIKRCTKIAQLLVEGKKGRELDQAIQEFDRVHVPEIVTRFEAPITARHYRRSSSAPAPDTEHSNPAFLGPEPSTPSKRQAKRSSSSQPEAPRVLSQDCATPSPLPSEADTESDWYSSPSSPYYPTTPSYSLPPTNPSFVSVLSLFILVADVLTLPVQDEFNTFSFDNAATSAMPPYQACDPLDQQGVYQVYQQDSQESCLPESQVYNPTCLTIDTSFMDSWTTASSPLSSMPGTPQTYPVMHGPSDAMSVMDNYLPHQLHESYDPSPEFLPQQQQLYTPAGLPAYCAPAGGVEMSFGAQGFAAPAKHDFASYYGRPAVDPVDAAAFSPAYMAYVGTDAM
ncbi:hypothetical protein TRAPUB_1608 [Trametes pubescens]|uniref:HMG box domain-containing protein n=1 Tax=Trametes pubescens TaxID=154538 RepID=A0A1M2VIW7_TRAPU|nr:hypothetical protein TRAPUB_1608 [Trametes pubescens]